MTIPIIATLAYGTLALFGGLVGYLKAKSKPSLISGISSGFLLLLSRDSSIPRHNLGKNFCSNSNGHFDCRFHHSLQQNEKIYASRFDVNGWNHRNDWINAIIFLSRLAFLPIYERVNQPRHLSLARLNFFPTKVS